MSVLSTLTPAQQRREKWPSCPLPFSTDVWKMRQIFLWTFEADGHTVRVCVFRWIQCFSLCSQICLCVCVFVPVCVVWCGVCVRIMEFATSLQKMTFKHVLMKISRCPLVDKKICQMGQNTRETGKSTSLHSIAMSEDPVLGSVTGFQNQDHHR